MTRFRNIRGGALVLSIVLALVLVVLGVGFLLMSMYMGGQSETKNAVDAGALNVGKKALDQITVDLSQSENQQIFLDVTNDSTDNSAPNDGKIDLTRINRVWAKALLIAINADAAQRDGTANSMANSAQQAFAGAQEISNALCDKLTKPDNLFDFFTEFAQQNSVRMIGKDVKVNVVPGSNWQTSLMCRTVPPGAAESNIVLSGNPRNNFNLPPKYTLDASCTTQCTRNPMPSGAQDLWFLKGYTAISAANQTYWQVPFRFDEKPHLVAKSTFYQGKLDVDPIRWNKPVPNAFSVEGAAINASVSGQRAISWVLTNPRQPFQLSMPHSFLHIKVDTFESHWFFCPNGYPPVEPFPPLTYGFTDGDQVGPPMQNGGILCLLVAPGPVNMGFEVVGATLDKTIFGPPIGGDVSLIEEFMVNRMNEMITAVPSKSYDAGDLHSLLNNPFTIVELMGGERDFYIYSPDGKSLELLPRRLVPRTSWLNSQMNNKPDGREIKPIDDVAMPAPISYKPMITPDPNCGIVLDDGLGFWEKEVGWTPGSGYNGCLGQIRIKRWTDCYSVGMCSP